MADRLDAYRAKRDPSATPEPFGAVEPASDPAGGRFVIQQHDATRLHWDLRLEHEGTLPSWALPKGLPLTPDRDHLAVRTEDHPLEYLTFAGTIPDGQYGAGHMLVWDEGTHEVVKWEDRKVVVDLHGRRAQGRYALFATGRGGRDGRDWMVHRMEAPADPARRRPLDAGLRPMRLAPGAAPAGEGWAWEGFHHGLRVLVVNEPGDTHLLDAEGSSLDELFPELRRVGRALGSAEVVLDGVVVGDVDDRLAARGRSASTIRRVVRDRPVRLAVFDLLWSEGYPVVEEPLAARRARLGELPLGDGGGPWSVPSVHAGDGAAVVEAARAAGVGTLVAKRLDAPYAPGATTDDWRRVDVSH